MYGRHTELEHMSLIFKIEQIISVALSKYYTNNSENKITKIDVVIWGSKEQQTSWKTTKEKGGKARTKKNIISF